MSQKSPQGTVLARREEGGGLSSWNPWNQLADMRRQMDDVVSRTFGYTPLSQMIPSAPGAWEPELDIYETDDRVQMFVSLPGCELSQINCEVTSDTVRISGERKQFGEHENAIAHRRSFLSGISRFDCTCSLPSEVNPNQVKATFRNGILQLDLTKTEQARLKAVKVNIQS